MSAEYDDEDFNEGEDFSKGDLNQCPDCGDSLDFTVDEDGFCWSCDF